MACEAWLKQADFDAVLAHTPDLPATSLPWPALQADALCLQDRALAALHRVDEAMPILQRAVALAEAHAARGNGEAPLARALGHPATACYLQGDRLTEALSIQRRAADMALRLGDPADHAIHSSNLVTFLHLQGLPAEALAQAESTHQSYRRPHASAGHPAAINDLTLGQCAWHQGQGGRALAVQEAAAEALSTDGAPPAAVLKVQVNPGRGLVAAGAARPGAGQPVRHLATARRRAADLPGPVALCPVAKPETGRDGRAAAGAGGGAGLFGAGAESLAQPGAAAGLDGGRAV